MKHTKEPFKLINNTDTVDIDQKSIGIDVSYPELSSLHKDRGLHIQIRHNKDKATFNEANRVAKLITAAPELLEALKQIELAQDAFTMSEIAKQAIAKAEGSLK